MAACKRLGGGILRSALSLLHSNGASPEGPRVETPSAPLNQGVAVDVRRLWLPPCLTRNKKLGTINRFFEDGFVFINPFCVIFHLTHAVAGS